MSNIYISFNLKSLSCNTENNSIYENDYNLVYKPLLQFLYSHEDFPFTLSFNGSQLEYFKKRKNELFSIARELIERKQLEVLGGGYYDPILSLIYPVDRNGQIEMLSTSVRHNLGKRPRGITLHSDVWDPSLVNNLHTCSIEYVLLDSSLIPENKQTFLPLIMSDLGKSVDIFPYYNELNPTADISPEKFIKNILESVEYVEKKNPFFQSEPERIINLSLDHKEMQALIEGKWFNKLYDYLKEVDNVYLTTPYYFRKEFKFKCPAYIPAGVGNSIGKYISSPFKVVNNKNKSNNTIYDFMETYKLSYSLYCRMMYVSLLVNQYKNDKQRKKAARDKLWQAQNGANLIWSSDDIKSNFPNRQKAYKYLMDSERVLREDGKFKESVTSFDYNNDGLNEYVCRMDNYFAYISLISGAVQELEPLKNVGNYADNLSRIAEFDGYTDNYNRGFFVDHIFNDKQFDQYINNEAAGDGVFSKIKYNEVKYSQAKREIQLEARATLKGNYQIYLKKKYIINSTGMYVQYILRNESEKKLRTKFAVESNFACYDIDGAKDFYSVEVVDDENSAVQKVVGEAVFDNVNGVRITDKTNSISFVFEPNELCGHCLNTIDFKRPDNTSEEVLVERTYVSTMFWDIEIDPGMETEKSFNFTVSSTKSSKRKKN